jgi:hypothetical protein
MTVLTSRFCRLARLEVLAAVAAGAGAAAQAAAPAGDLPRPDDGRPPALTRGRTGGRRSTPNLPGSIMRAGMARTEPGA